MFDKITEGSLLYDFYGQLLTERQKEVLRLYHEENYSLSEIAEEFGISRQAVHDALKNAEKSLVSYEEKLGLVKRFSESRAAILSIADEINRIKEAHGNDTELAEKLDRIRRIIEELE